MIDPATLSKQELLQQLASRDQQLAAKDDVIAQLQVKLDQKERDFLKLWQERFGARSERYIADPDQLKLDFGNTPESEDAAAGLHLAQPRSPFRLTHAARRNATSLFRHICLAPKSSTTCRSPKKLARNTEPKRGCPIR